MREKRGKIRNFNQCQVKALIVLEIIILITHLYS